MELCGARRGWIIACYETAATVVDVKSTKAVPPTADVQNCAESIRNVVRGDCATVSRATAIVREALSDDWRITAVNNGREVRRAPVGIFCGHVSRFLSRGVHGDGSRAFARRMPHLPYHSGLSVSADGQTLLMAGIRRDSLVKLSMADGVQRYEMGSFGWETCQFNTLTQVFLCADGFVFAAEFHNERVQVLKPDLSFHSFIGANKLIRPFAVAANANVVVASTDSEHRVAVFCRRDGALVTSFGKRGSGDGQIEAVTNICFMFQDTHLVIVDWGNSRVSVFTCDGDFVRHIGAGVLKRPESVACSVANEIVVCDTCNWCLRLFSGSGALLQTFGRGVFSGVCIRGSTLTAFDDTPNAQRIVVWVNA